MNRWRGVIVDEQLGLQARVEALRWRVEVLPSCPADVRAAMADGEPWEGTARNEREAIERALVALGRVQGFVLARRQPRQTHIFAAQHFDHQRDQDWVDLRVGVEAAVLAAERGWTWVALSILMAVRQRSTNRYALYESGRVAARQLADLYAGAMRRRRLPL